MTKWPSMPALAPAVNGITWRATFGQVAVSARAVSCWRVTAGPPTWRCSTASSRITWICGGGSLLNRAARRAGFGVFGADGRAGLPDHLVGVAGCLEDPGHQVSVNPDAGRLSLHGDVAAGEHVAVGGPPAAPAGVAAELDQSLPLRRADTVQVEHVLQVVGSHPGPPVPQPVQLAGAPAEPLRSGFHRQAAAMAQPLDLADQAPSPDGRAVLHASPTSSGSCFHASVSPHGSGPQHIAATLCCE